MKTTNDRNKITVIIIKRTNNRQNEILDVIKLGRSTSYMYSHRWRVLKSKATVDKSRVGNQLQAICMKKYQSRTKVGLRSKKCRKKFTAGTFLYSERHLLLKLKTAFLNSCVYAHDSRNAVPVTDVSQSTYC